MIYSRLKIVSHIDNVPLIREVFREGQIWRDKKADVISVSCCLYFDNWKIYILGWTTIQCSRVDPKNWHSCILPPHTQCWFDWVSKAKATKLRSHEESGLLWPAEREKTHPFYFLLDVSQDEGITKIGLYCLFMISGTSLSFRSCCQLAQCQSVRLDFFANVYQPLHLHLGKWQTNWMRQLLRVEASVLTEIKIFFSRHVFGALYIVMTRNVPIE